MQLDIYSGRLTYRRLAEIITKEMTEEQKDCDVTAADPLSRQGNIECGDYGAVGLNLIVPDQDGLDDLGLDDDHPIFIALEIGE